jgi:hypothetical protein
MSPIKTELPPKSKEKITGIKAPELPPKKVREVTTSVTKPPKTVYELFAVDTTQDAGWSKGSRDSKQPKPVKRATRVTSPSTKNGSDSDVTSDQR